jgi:hypothetical protein
MHAVAAIRDPGRQCGPAHGLAGGNVGADRFGDLGSNRLPARFQKGPWVPAEAPAHGEIDIPRVVGNVFQLHGTVMEHVAEDRPEKLCLRMRRGPQGRELLGRVLHLEDRRDVVGDRAGRGPVALLRSIEHLDFLAQLLEDAATGVFWPSAPCAISPASQVGAAK